MYGHCADISIKPIFPGYACLRTHFADQLDRVIADNTRIPLKALTPLNTAP